MMKCLMKHQKFHATENLCIQFEAPLHEQEFIVQLETCDAVDPSLHTLEVTTPGKCESQLRCVLADGYIGLILTIVSLDAACKCQVHRQP